MSDLLKSVFDLPDVSFIGNDTLEAMMQRLVTNYEKRYEEITGTAISLAAGDPIRVLLYAAALDLFQTEEYVDRAGKQDLLKYSYGEFLDNLAANRGVTRKAASAAVTTIRFTASEVKDYALSIPEATRVTNGDGIYFKTTEYAEIAAGAEYVDVEVVCTETGVRGNDLLAGQINVLVDPLPYIETVANITTSDGGAAEESDESLAERVYLAPSSYSVAGPSDAYAFWARTYNAGIGSVKPTTPEPGAVDLYILMADGTLPEDEMIEGLQEFIQSEEIRPMTDLVTVKRPGVVDYSIALTYYIRASDKARAVTIQQEVQEAVDAYVAWQSAEIDRDINPDELLRRIMAAGAKRVELTAPAFTVVSDTEVAQCSSRSVNYGGLEDD